MPAIILALILWIGPILPTPVPLVTYQNFAAVAVSPGVARVTWRGTGGVFSVCAPSGCLERRWRAGANVAWVEARVGDAVELRDAPGQVLAGGRVVGRVWLAFVGR